MKVLATKVENYSVTAKAKDGSDVENTYSFTVEKAVPFLLTTAEPLDRREEEQRAALEWAESQDWRTGDTVITLALHIDDVDRAWAAADRWGADCTWQALADAEPQPRPDDAIDLYRHRVKEVLRKTGRPSAQQAVAMASCMRRIAVTADDQHAGRHLRAFNAWVDDLRETLTRSEEPINLRFEKRLIIVTPNRS